MTLRVVSPTKVRYGWHFEQALDAGIKLAACVAAGFGAFRVQRSNNPDLVVFYGLIVTASLIAVGEVIRYVIRLRKQPSGSDLHALDAVVQAIYESIKSLASSNHAPAELRLCVFVVDHKNPDLVHQLTDYIGPPARSGSSRTMSSRSGAVGEAIRDGIDGKFMSPGRQESTIDYLVNKGFHRSEAAGMDLTRRSWAAVPIGNGPGNVLAVLYGDAKTDGFWGNTTDNKRKVMLAAAIAIAKHIG